MPFDCSYVINGDHFGLFWGGGLGLGLGLGLVAYLLKKDGTVERKVLVQL